MSFNTKTISGGGPKGMTSGSKAMAQYSNKPGAYAHHQQHIQRATVSSSQQHYQQSSLTHQLNTNNSKYSSSSIGGVINPQSTNVTLSALSTTPQVRTRSPHAKIRGSG